MKMRKKLTAVLAAALVPALLVGCAGKEETVEEALPTGIAVQVKTIEKQDVATESKVSGSVTADSETTIYVGTTAKCTAVFFEAGDEVKKGDVICTLDLGSTLASYSASRISYDSAAASYEQQKKIFDNQLEMAQQQITLSEQGIALSEKSIAIQENALENTKALYQIGAASKNEVDMKELELERSKTQLESSRVELEGLQTQILSTQAQRDSTLAQLRSGMESTRANLEQLGLVIDDVDAHGNVIAPADGRLATLNAKEGGYTSPNVPLAIISGAEQMKITVSISEALVPKLSIGDTARVYVASAGAEFSGSIRSVEQVANEQTKLYGVTISVPGDVSGLLSGMFAEVTFFTETASDTIAIPSEAIVTVGEDQYAFVVEDGTAKRMDVTTGLIGDGVTEILGGLSAGQTLVVVGQQYLSDGDAVRIVGGM